MEGSTEAEEPNETAHQDPMTAKIDMSFWLLSDLSRFLENRQKLCFELCLKLSPPPYSSMPSSCLKLSPPESIQLGAMIQVISKRMTFGESYLWWDNF